MTLNGHYALICTLWNANFTFSELIAWELREHIKPPLGRISRCRSETLVFDVMKIVDVAGISWKDGVIQTRDS